MSDYQLEIKQVVDYPRCRIYREFVQTLIADRSIRTNGGSGLFYYTVLCSYANFRTSYRRLDGITYTIYPGEWVFRVSELAACFRVRFQHKALSILKVLQDRQLITFTQLGHGHLVKYSIKGWRKHNTVLDYNCPCQKESGFFFMPTAVATELISYGKASEMDVVLDLWLSAIYKDAQVLGSEVGPVVYLRNGTGNPLLNYSDLAQRWGLSRSTVGRLLNKLSALEYLTLMSFPGRTGSVIYLNSYLSTMFQVSDVMVDKDEVAMCLNIRVQLPDAAESEESHLENPKICVSDQLISVSKTQAGYLTEKVAQILETQGVPCFNCPKSTVKLYPLSSDCTVVGIGGTSKPQIVKLGLTVQCGNDHPVYSFELTLSVEKMNF